MASTATATSDTSTLHPGREGTGPAAGEAAHLGLQDALKPVEPGMQAAPVGLKLGTDVALESDGKTREKDIEDQEVVERDVERGMGEGATTPGEPDVYDRFPPRKKHIIVATVSLAAFLSPVTSSAFLPSIPQIALDTKSSPDIIAYTVAIFIAVMGLAPLLWAPLSVFYGRRGVYLASLPIYIAGCVGVSRSTTVGAIIGTRVLQATGSSSVLAVGAGTVGDIYRPTERATAMGWYYSGVRPAFSPVIAGVFQEYTAQTWRSMQYFLAGIGVVAFLAIVFFLPETYHGKTPHQIACEERGKRFVPYWFNPFTSVLLLRWPNICLIAANSSCQLVTAYGVLVPLSTVFKERFHIDNAAILGLLYLSTGMGNLIGTRVAGRVADSTVKKWMLKRGYRRPEDRLRATLLAGLTILPMPLITYGWIVEKNLGGLAAPMVLLAINGFGLMMVLNPCNTYCVDSMQQRSAEVIACSNMVRYLFSAGASASVLPVINSIGFGWTNTIMTVISYAGMACVILTYKQGSVWRERANAKHGVTYREADEIRPDEEKQAQAQAETTEAAVSSKDEKEDPGDQVADLQRGMSMRRTASKLPQPSALLSRTHSLTEAHHH